MYRSAEIVFWVCLGLVVYSYVVYPALVWLLARLFGRRQWSGVSGQGGQLSVVSGQWSVAELPMVSLLIAAHNEERVIEKKVLNSLELDYPRDRLRIVVASDGSSDATPQIVQRYADRGVRLMHCPERRGKAATLNAVIEETEGREGEQGQENGGQKDGGAGEILVLSDANTEYRPDAVRKLVRWFADPRVDVVCGRLILHDAQSGQNADGVYWRYETFLKRCEGRLGALLGANGAIYAIRRRAYVPVASNTIIDDFVIPLLSKLRHKGRIVYEPEAVAVEETPPSIGMEFRRRVRIGTGAYQCLAVLWRLLDPRYGWTAFVFFSHKVLRWAGPFLLLAALAANLLLVKQPLYQVMLAGQLAIVALAIAGACLPGRGIAMRLVRALSMLAGMNLALLFGFWQWLSRRQTGTWKRTAR